MLPDDFSHMPNGRPAAPLVADSRHFRAFIIGAARNVPFYVFHACNRAALLLKLSRQGPFVLTQNPGDTARLKLARCAPVQLDPLR